MKIRSLNSVVGVALGALLACAPVNSISTAHAQQPQQDARASATRGDGTPAQRLSVMRSRLDAMRRSLNSAVAALNAGGGAAEKTKNDAAKTISSSEEARARLRGLEREVGSVISDVGDLRGKQERAERFETSDLDKLETAVEDLNRRVEDVLRNTAEARRATGGTSNASASNAKKKKGGGLLGKLNPFGGGDDEDKYAELTGTVAPGRDRELFELAAKRTRKGNYEEGRLLFNVITTTYTESPFLPLSKLAVADSFYLEGTTSALIQANASYREWLTFFPTHPLADDVMLKMAESEMRQMGLADRDTSHARKAEQQLKVVLQQFPETPLRSDVQLRMNEVQENLAMHNLQVANFYLAKYAQGKAANPRGGQSRLREIVEKYPNFSYLDEVLYNLGVTYVQEEEPDEAAKYFVRLMRERPNSRFAERAGEQLDLIGVARPQPDPEALKIAEPERPGMTAKLFSEVFGRVPITVTKDGVLISKNSEEGKDLIDEAIARGGELQNDRTPNAPNFRRAPAQAPVPRVNQPAPVTAPANPSGNTGGVAIRPTQPGAPPGTSNVPTQKQAPAVTETAVPTTATPARTEPDAPANATPPANGTASSTPPTA